MNKKRKTSRHDARVMVPLTVKQKAHLEAHAASEGISMAQVIRSALAHYVECTRQVKATSFGA